MSRRGRNFNAFVVRGRNARNDAVDGLDVNGIAMSAGALCKDRTGGMGVRENERPAAHGAFDQLARSRPPDISCRIPMALQQAPADGPNAEWRERSRRSRVHVRYRVTLHGLPHGVAEWEEFGLERRPKSKAQQDPTLGGGICARGTGPPGKVGGRERRPTSRSSSIRDTTLTNRQHRQRPTPDSSNRTARYRDLRRMPDSRSPSLPLRPPTAQALRTPGTSSHACPRLRTDPAILISA